MTSDSDTTVTKPSVGAGSIFPSSLLDRRSYMTSYLTPCRNGTAGQPSSGSGQLLPGPTIALGPFLRLSAAPYG
jgi:hypothetical protein